MKTYYMLYLIPAFFFLLPVLYAAWSSDKKSARTRRREKQRQIAKTETARNHFNQKKENK